MRVVVTGGAGFIGHHLTHVLAAQGVGVTVLDTVERPDTLPDSLGIDYHQGTILDDALVDRLIRRADIVVHLAGIAEPMRYGSDPLATMDVNLLGSINVARRCADRHVPIVFSSTSEIYGINPELPWAEDADRVLGPIRNVRWCYSTAKAAVEHYLDACRRELGLHYTVVRLFNTYGSGLHGRVVDRFIGHALAGEPIVIHGDGRQTRCFCYIDDMTDALARIVTRPVVGARTYNIGAVTETSIADLADLVIDLCGSGSVLQTVLPSALYDGYQDVPRRRPNIGAIERDLGWMPTTTLRDGLHLTINAMRNAMEPAGAG